MFRQSEGFKLGAWVKQNCMMEKDRKENGENKNISKTKLRAEDVDVTVRVMFSIFFFCIFFHPFVLSNIESNSRCF